MTFGMEVDASVIDIFVFTHEAPLSSEGRSKYICSLERTVIYLVMNQAFKHIFSLPLFLLYITLAPLDRSANNLNYSAAFISC